MAAGNGQSPYHVSTPLAVRQRFGPWAALAARLGLRAEYIADLKTLDARLLYTPRAWGDPLKEYGDAKLDVFRGLTEYLIAIYAVHKEQRLVFVRDILLRPDRPLGQAE